MDHSPASLMRRLAALVYDLLLLAAIWMAGTALLLPLSGGEAITPGAQGTAAYLYRLYLLALAAGYFGLSWTRRGQTVGLVSWKLRLERDDGSLPGWGLALLRGALGALLLLAAAAGAWLLATPGGWAARAGGAALLLVVVANYAAMTRDPWRRTLQDRACGCRLRRLAPPR